MKKILFITLKIMLIMITLITASISKAGIVNAAQENDKLLYKKDEYANMLSYKGVEILTTYVVYKENGVEYPAYCIDMDKPGVGEKGSYSVDASSQLNDVNLWKVVRNGYPYLSVSELGCSNAGEAYTATKHAIYCYLASRSVDDYDAIGEAGNRVKNAMKKIMRLADATTKYSTEFTLRTNQSGFEIDKKDSKYMSQTFFMSAYYSLFDVKLSLEGDYPEGTKIVDYNNKEITKFEGYTSFKVIYPIQNAKKSGTFNLKAVATMNTYPVLYGKSYNSSNQDYALTTSRLGDSETIVPLRYSKNSTQLTINKQDDITKKPLEGVKFRVLDSGKKPVYTDLITDVNGKIILENLLPGTYYIEEVATKEGYVKYEELIPVELELLQKMTVTVNNTKESKTEYNESKAEINVTQNSSHTIINKDNVTINKNENTSFTDINVSDQNKNENKQENNTNIDVDFSNSNENKQETNNNINTSNENTNINKQETNNNTNTSNENTNINKQETNSNINTSNENTNINKQETNNNINTSNENTNINQQETNNNINTSNENTNINKQETNSNINTSNENTNINKQETNNNINTSNENANINQQGVNTSISTSDENNNISNLNGIVKLPKTGM